MNNISIVDYSDKDKINLIVAQKGFWNTTNNNWTLYNGSVSTINSGIESSIINFSKYQIRFA